MIDRLLVVLAGISGANSDLMLEDICGRLEVMRGPSYCGQSQWSPFHGKCVPGAGGGEGRGPLAPLDFRFGWEAETHRRKRKREPQTGSGHTLRLRRCRQSTLLDNLVGRDTSGTDRR